MDYGGKAKEGRYMLRCAAGAQNNSNELISRTMLRFRPIAPKPASSDTVSGNVLVDNKNLLLSGKRSKRKYVRVRKNNGYRRNNNNNNTKETNHENRLNKNGVTLQLLPERPTIKDQESFSWFNYSGGSAKVDDNENNNNNYREDLTAAIWLNIKGKDSINGVGGVSDQRVVESWVTVESVTGTCMDHNTTRGLVMKVDLEEDTCPGFVSDDLNRVLWVNRAYKKMVTSGGGDGSKAETDVCVWLVIKEELPTSDYSFFTTKVKLQYTWRQEKYSKIVPCDVFRTDGGGFAWRLDVEAALSLGR